jgi:hypothetical protein
VRAVLLIVLAACGRVGFDPLSNSSRDASLDPTICDDGLSGVLFCESFEGDLGSYDFQATAPNYVIADAAHVYRGALALHSHSESAGSRAWLVQYTLPHIVSGDLWARWYMYVPAVPATIDLSTLELIEDPMPYGGVILGIHTAELVVYAVSTSATAPISIARDKWVCLQEHIVISSTAGSVDTWLDGTPGPSLANVDTLPATSYTDIHTPMYSNNPAPQDVWTDEIVVGTAAVPCD